MKKIILYTFFLSIVLTKSSFGFNQNNSWNKNNNFNYDSLYSESIALIEKDEVSKSIKILIEITASSKNRGLILNSYYDLGQIYLSRSSDYDKSIEYFNFIFNSSFSYKLKSESQLRSFLELKEKSLFMIGYIYHNHIGNLTKAQKYYNLFLNNYPNSDLVSSVSYELEIINESINQFNQQIKNN
tara:strand:+ start:211 stop:765 length:555 start_codon:yes stop_codon:yes gene_type:complete